MNAHAELIRRFYDAFARRDAEAMAACYHAQVSFADEVFPDLRGPDAGNMWRMLCSRAADWAWSRQALGPAGWLMGWSGMLKRKVQRQAGENLAKFIAKGKRQDP